MGRLSPVGWKNVGSPTPLLSFLNSEKYTKILRIREAEEVKLHEMNTNELILKLY